MSTFSIVPIAGREVIQKNFVTLPAKAENYNNRRISLNERFSVVERGYALQPQDTVKSGHTVQLLAEVPSDAVLTQVAQDTLDMYLEKKARAEKESASRECSTAETTPVRSPVAANTDEGSPQSASAYLSDDSS